MTIHSLLTDYSAYNLWANRTTVEWLRSKPLELMVQEMPSSYPTIHDTLLHIWGAEEIWLNRLQGNSPITFLTNRFEGDTNAVFEGLVGISEQFHQFVSAAETEYLETVCPFKLLNGTEDAKTRIEMIQHCMNHSTYHRGQIVTMARNVGITDPPSTDLIRYLRNKPA